MLRACADETRRARPRADDGRGRRRDPELDENEFVGRFSRRANNACVCRRGHVAYEHEKDKILFEANEIRTEYGFGTELFVITQK